jgi:predicted esterase
VLVCTALSAAVAMGGAACSRCDGVGGGATSDAVSSAPPGPLPSPSAPDSRLPPRDVRAATRPTTTRSPGCGRSPTSAVRGEARKVLGDRTFHLWTPESFDPARAYPVLFTFHGWSSSGRGLEKWFKMQDYVAGEAIVVYPDSAGNAWDFHGDRDLDFFDAMVADLAGAYCIDLTRVYAFGFSYGGKITHRLGCNRPEALRGIAVGGSDWRTNERHACGQVPVIIVHRTSDASEPVAWGRASAATWAGINQCDAATAPPALPADAEALGCKAYGGCLLPVVYCEDTHVDPSWEPSWNHTVRERHRAFVWRWLAALPPADGPRPPAQ